MQRNYLQSTLSDTKLDQMQKTTLYQIERAD